MNPHLFIATPAYSGKVNVQYALALADTMCLLRAAGVQVTSRIVTSGSLLVAERNRLLEAFWQSGASHMLCIDGDLGWPPQAVFNMLDSGKDFIAGVYPARGVNTDAFLFRPVQDENGIIESQGPLLKMDYIPAGFMMITRNLVGKMREKFPEKYYSPKDPRSDRESTFCLFNTEVYEGEFWGEDYVFCRLAREAGFEIWVDPYIQFDHDGKVGALVQALTQQKTDEATNENLPIQP